MVFCASARRNRLCPRWPVGVCSGCVLSRSDAVPGVFDSFLDSSYGIMLGARILHLPKKSRSLLLGEEVFRKILVLVVPVASRPFQ